MPRGKSRSHGGHLSDSDDTVEFSETHSSDQIMHRTAASVGSVPEPKKHKGRPAKTKAASSAQSKAAAAASASS